MINLEVIYIGKIKFFLKSGILFLKMVRCCFFVLRCLCMKGCVLFFVLERLISFKIYLVNRVLWYI